jgi:antitoxin component HigA of HigAB toxin-antitoxin module
MKFISGNGWSFDSDGVGASLCNDYAKQLNLKGVTVWLATAPEGKQQEYSIFDGNEPVYATTSMEAIGAHLDIIALQRFGTHPNANAVLGSTSKVAEALSQERKGVEEHP